MSELDDYFKKFEKYWNLPGPTSVNNLKEKISSMKLLNDKSAVIGIKQRRFLTNILCDIIHEIYFSDISQEEKQKFFQRMDSVYPLTQNSIDYFLANARE